MDLNTLLFDNCLDILDRYGACLERSDADAVAGGPVCPVNENASADDATVLSPFCRW